jgi:hypothetical protein
MATKKDSPTKPVNESSKWARQNSNLGPPPYQALPETTEVRRFSRGIQPSYLNRRAFQALAPHRVISRGFAEFREAAVAQTSVVLAGERDLFPAWFERRRGHRLAGGRPKSMRTTFDEVQIAGADGYVDVPQEFLAIEPLDQGGA